MLIHSRSDFAFAFHVFKTSIVPILLLIIGVLTSWVEGENTSPGAMIFFSVSIFIILLCCFAVNIVSIIVHIYDYFIKKGDNDILFSIFIHCWVYLLIILQFTSWQEEHFREDYLINCMILFFSIFPIRLILLFIILLLKNKKAFYFKIAACGIAPVLEMIYQRISFLTLEAMFYIIFIIYKQYIWNKESISQNKS